MMELNGRFTFKPTNPLKNIIKVIGVGGGGTNAVNYMYERQIKDVDFIVSNTDIQSLESSPVPVKIQLGEKLTEGLGAGTFPVQGRKAAEESIEQIRKILLGYDPANPPEDAIIEDPETKKPKLKPRTKMLFITAGMGGGTGTGAAPVIAGIAKEYEILTVAIVTKPFEFEGPEKLKQAEEGIEELEKNCDTVLVILNEKLLTADFKKLKKSKAFEQADEVLAKAAKSIAEVITMPGKVNVDFMDVQMVLKRAGKALMGAAEAVGEDRALKAIEQALSSPLLESQDIRNAQRVLFTMAYSHEHEITMEEQAVITEFIKQKIGGVVPIAKNGDIFDDALGETLRITIVAAGFGEKKEEVATKDIVQPTSNEPTASTGESPNLPIDGQINTPPQEPIDDGTEELPTATPMPEPEPDPQVRVYEYVDTNRSERIAKMKAFFANKPQPTPDMEEIPTFQRYHVKLISLQDIQDELVRYSLNES